MTTLLLVLIYIIYIGLGIPDSVTGSSWVAVSTELNIPIGYESFITSTISLFTVIASFFSAKIINKFGTGIVVAFSTLLTAIALLGYSFANSLLWLCICSIPSGFGAGAIDAALNNYVSVNYKPILVNFLHCFYGVGIALSPLVFSVALKILNWRSGYRMVFCIQLFITIVSFFTLIVWRKVKQQDKELENFKPVTLSYKQMIKNPALRLSWLVFFSTCSLEFTCGHWGATYLELSEGAVSFIATRLMALYYVGITVGRFIAGILTVKISNRSVIYSGYSIILLAMIILFLPVNSTIKGVGLFLIGLGNGPTFPNLSYLSPKYFGKEYSQSVISSQMVMCNLGITLMPAVFGFIAQNLSLKAFPYYNAFFYVVMVLCTVLYFNKIDKTEKQIFVEKQL